MLVAFDIFYVVVIPLVYENRNEKNTYQNDDYEISGWEATVNEDNLVVDDAEVVQIFTHIWQKHKSCNVVYGPYTVNAAKKDINGRKISFCESGHLTVFKSVVADYPQTQNWQENTSTENQNNFVRVYRTFFFFPRQIFYFGIRRLQFITRNCENGAY